MTRIKELFLDTETRSEVPIRQGVRRYVRGEFFEPILVPWAVDDGKEHIWDVLQEPMPSQLEDAYHDERVSVILHNSSFDRWVLNVSELFGKELTTDRINDTMVQALAHGLPAGLGKLSEVFGLGGDGKDDDGRRLIQLFCVPNFRKKDGGITFNDWTTHPEDWEKFRQYALRDITAMRKIYRRMPRINYPGLEHKLWELDQEINDRGIPVNVEFAQAAIKAATAERDSLNKATNEATDGEVEAATQRAKLLMHMAAEHDVWLPDLKSATLERRLDDPDLPPVIRHLIELRIQSSKNSAAKYRRVVQHEVDGFLNFTMQMYGAARTGRDAGRVFQPQNLMRPTMWRGLSGHELESAITVEIMSIMLGVVGQINSDVMSVLGNCIRSVIQAKTGKKFVVSDLSNIEGRGLVWLSDESWKLKYFQDYDDGLIKYDNYIMAYAQAMNVPPESVDSYQRNIGKVMELGLGYGGGVAAFITFANVYRLDLQELAEAVWSTGDLAHLEECKNKYEWAKDNGYHAGLSEFQYAAAEYLKQLWRHAHPRTVEFWGALEQAFRSAAKYENETFTVGRLKFRRVKSWLYIRLPSGRVLTYLNPRIVDGTVTFMGLCPFTKQFKRVKTYSGRLAENVTSGTARDVMFHRMPEIEEAGYPIVMRVHDELVTHVPDSSEYNVATLSNLMSKPHAWSTGLPLAAAGFEAKLYRKE